MYAFETRLAWGDEDSTQHLRALLERDGFTVDDSGRIRSGISGALASVPLESLDDPSAILEHLHRLAEHADTDPAAAISGAKALIEATTNVILKELNRPYDENADVPALVRAAQTALKLHPGTLAPTAIGVEITKRSLSNLSQLAIGIAELRNQYGPDHGRSSAVVGLGPRDVHLAIGVATTYCRMLLETRQIRRS